MKLHRKIYCRAVMSIAMDMLDAGVCRNEVSDLLCDGMNGDDITFGSDEEIKDEEEV